MQLDLPNTLETLDVSFQDSLVTIALNRPKVHNAMNALMLEELTSVLKAVQGTVHCHFVVLKAHGKHFCSGADLHWMKAQSTMNEQENKIDAKKLADVLALLDQLPQTTIAVIQGVAYGGACGLIACCDIALCDNNSKFCFSEVKLGLIPALISPYIIRCLGTKRSKAWMLSAQPFDAQQALQFGLIHQVCHDLSQESSTLIHQLKENSAPAMMTLKKFLKEQHQLDISSESQNDCIEAIANIRVSEEAQQRMQHFLQKD